MPSHLAPDRNVVLRRTLALPSMLLLLLGLTSAGAAPAEVPAWTNENSRVLSILEAEGFSASGEGAEARPADTYRAAAPAECAGVVEVEWRGEGNRPVPVSGVELLAYRADASGAYLPQAYSRVAGATTQERLVVRGGAPFRIEVSYVHGIDEAGKAASVSRRYSVPVGCDSIVPLEVRLPATGSVRGAADVTATDGRDASHQARPMADIEKIFSRVLEADGDPLSARAKATRLGDDLG
ncbi:MAG: hypothetical protein MI919_23605, partial [Holophagales bacterium]|nr:hypothetical protein [Holophagales bacterium]